MYKWTKEDTINAVLFRKWKKPGFVLTIKSLLKPVEDLYNELMAFKQFKEFQLSITFQVASMEKYLNDKYSTSALPLNYNPYTRTTDFEAGKTNGNGTIIFIENHAKGDGYYLFQEEENLDEVWLYNMWVNTVSYSIDDRVIDGNKVYKALTTNSGKQPSANTSDWKEEEEVVTMDSLEGLQTFDHFVVHVPSSVSFKEKVLRKQIEFYALAGRRFRIETY